MQAVMCTRTLLTALMLQSAVLLSSASDVPAPVFRSVPTTIKTSIHDTVLLPCYVENLGTNIIRWWKNDKLLWDTGDVRVLLPSNMRIFPNQTLEVADLQDSDTGDYICQVVRPHPWNPINQVHAIEVLVPPQVKSMPENGEVEVELGHEVIMGCIAKGVPTPIVTWSFKGKAMELINNRATLRWTATDRKMSGIYQCTANNGVGDIAAATIRLKVLYRPEVSADRIWIHTSPGERAEISCTVLAEPEAKIEWFHEDQAVDLHDGRLMMHKEGDKHKLIIKRVTSSDLGFFTCKASNRFGRGQQSIHLSGIAHPASFKRGPKQSSSHNYTLIWEVESYSSIVEYKLLFKNHEAPADRNWAEIIIPADLYSLGPIYSQSYTLTGLRPSTVYEAAIISRNRFGWSRPSHIFRFATKGSDVPQDSATQSTLATSQDPTFVIIQNLIVQEDELQQLQEQEEIKEPYGEMITSSVQGSEGDDTSPVYEGNTRTWNAGTPSSTCYIISWLMAALFWLLL